MRSCQLCKGLNSDIKHLAKPNLCKHISMSLCTPCVRLTCALRAHYACTCNITLLVLALRAHAHNTKMQNVSKPVFNEFPKHFERTH